MMYSVRHAAIALFSVYLAGIAPSIAQAPTAAPAQVSPQQGPWARFPPAISSQTFQEGGAEFQIDFAAGDLDLPQSTIVGWVHTAAHSVAVYYGHFPVARVRILIVPVPDRKQIQGTTWGDMHGFAGFTRIRLGQYTQAGDLAEDWTMTHELVHMGFPDVPDDQHWIEEGLATYIEPIARVQAGQLTAVRIWGDMARDMPKGEPRAGDEGLDKTHTWGRTYWGGALFCLSADVAIRKQTGNRKGLQDALRAIVNAGGTIDHEWPLPKALQIGDEATGTKVLTTLYQQQGQSATPVDLDSLWSELGVRATGRSQEAAPSAADAAGGEVQFDSKAPMASIREAITKPEP